MDTLKEFAFKQKKYMPVFPKAIGKPTIYIEGYPYEDDEPMAASEFHAEQIVTFADQLKRYFRINPLVHIAVDCFLFYSEGDISKCVAPDIFVVLGVEKYPLRRSFYTWSEGAVPVTVFEFLSESTAPYDRHRKVEIYLNDIGVQEYFIHQPEMDKPAEFCGWWRSSSGDMVEMEPDTDGGLFSSALNLLFRWEDDHTTHVRLLRPYLPDGTPITTSMEEEQLRLQEKELRLQEEILRLQEEILREEAEERAAAETKLRQEAEAKAAAEAKRRQEAESELEQLRVQLANRQNETP